jgi:alkylation response protein AidB-like acyl-CoA dehydrogenase
MDNYQAPLRDFRFLLEDVFDANQLWERLPGMSGVSTDFVRTVLEEGARIASRELAPINHSGDREGCEWADGTVTTPQGFRQAFTALGEGGWLSMNGNPDYGGQGLPKMLTVLIEEMFYSANTSLFLYGTLTAGAAYCIESHGTEAVKRRYLPPLYDGRWGGAMAMTEPQAGSDLGLIRTRAEPQADGTYRVKGTKLYLTGGEHDLTENIIHLVLARLPDAPAGTRGLSMFLVPKFLVDERGALGRRNKLRSLSIEHKMGINGSATSLMEYDEATGWLVGEPHQGLATMFTMMNYERLSVGMQGLGLSAIAVQSAGAYAQQRLQGRAPAGPVHPDESADPITAHPDVRRMLLVQRALVEGGRAFAILVGRELDLVRYADDDDEREQAAAFVGLLTPVAKAFLTDRGLDCCVLAQQVFGGAGFIVETGVEQFVRDCRIAQIYEGTNGIQAQDLIGRKVLRDGGATLSAFVDRLRAELPRDARHYAATTAEFDRLIAVTADLIERCEQDPNLAGAIATDFLELFGYTVYAWLWARMDACAGADEFGQAKRYTAQFYFDRVLPRADALVRGIRADSNALMAVPDAMF